MNASFETSWGHVRGIHQADCVAFRGIPYAKAPTGPLRWRPPSPPDEWSGTRDTIEFAPDAIQFGDASGSFDDEDRPESEDSLVLNVWTPALAPARRPIMVFFHGGGFVFGGSARQLYDGRFLAAEGDVVVVTVNYRLGPMGLLAHPAWCEPKSGPAANWALLDQIAALRWVHEHADAIGGDPANVTIFGESAGSVSVGMLCVSPCARGLFQKAIMQSGAPMTLSLGQAHHATRSLCNVLDLDPDDIEVLRAVPLDVIKRSQAAWLEPATRRGYALRPVSDGEVIPAPPLDLAAAGATREIQLVVGTNRDEFNLFALHDLDLTRLDEAALPTRVEALVGPGYDAKMLIETYREARAERGESIEPWRVYAAIATDDLIRLDSLRFLGNHVASGGTGYSYVFDWESPNPVLGSCHGMELPFCFGTLGSAPGMREFAGAGTEADQLRGKMLQAWSNFARDEGHAFGPAFNPHSRPCQRFGLDSAVIEAPQEPERVVWSEGGVAD